MRGIVLLLILNLFPVYLFPTVWQRKIVNYERNEYHAGFQNWEIAQNKNGWMYIANTHGLLEFDGTYWNIYPMKNKIVRTLQVEDQKIYVGGSSEFGYFEPDITGKLTYISLSESVPEWGGEVWDIYRVNGLTYFVDEYYIQIFKEGQLQKSISTFTKIDCSTLINNSVYIGTPEGIYYINDQQELEYLEASQIINRNKIVELIPYQNQLLVITALSGIYSIQDNKARKVHTAANDFINSNQLFCASLKGTKLALGSVQAGVFLFDLEEDTPGEIFNLRNGLKNNTVLHTFFDKEGSLWLGLDKGISYVDLNSPLRPLFAETSPIGTGYCSALFNGELYLGTNQGVYKTDRKSQYSPVKNGEGQIWSMHIYDNTLFCSGDNGILVVTSQESYKIPLRGIWEVRPLASDPTRLIAGTYSGFAILKKENGKWNFSHQVNDFYYSTRGFLEDEVPNHFWVTDRGEIHRVALDPELTEVKELKKYRVETIKIRPNTSFQKIDNNLLICGEDGIWVYSRITDDFIPYAQLESLLKGPQYYEFLYVDDYKNFWFVYDKQLHFLEYTPQGYIREIYNWGMQEQLIDNYVNIQVIDSLSAIVAVDNGFIKLNLQETDTKEWPDAFIRKIENTRTDSVVSYNGYDPVFLAYKDNSINIYFGSTYFTGNEEVLYSYRLKGIDKHWSLPSSKTIKEYTNLREGKYQFEIKTVSANEKQEGNIKTITFQILPPWYRSLWAYIFYFLLLIGLLAMLYIKTVRKQKKLLLQKKEELIRQKKRHETEQKLKDQEIYTLQNENLRQELQLKTQELTGYMLNVQQKNEILENLKKEVVSISRALDENKDPKILKQKITRLISAINSNIEHDKDFDVFKSNFDLIHQDFFKVLSKSYPQLTKSDKMLCAYLKMNLSTKEIAPFLNITVRGVEVMRYRLRKKMHLDREVNLTEYMQKLAGEETDNPNDSE